MAARRSRNVSPRPMTPLQFERTLFPRNWVVVGHVLPHVRGAATYKTVSYARSAEAAVRDVRAACALRKVTFHLHSVAPMGSTGGFGRPRNAMGPI